MDKITIYLHHGGSFVNDGISLKYEGGECDKYREDPDRLSFHDFSDGILKLGYGSKNYKLYYLIPGKPMHTGLRCFYYDGEIIEMIETAQRNSEIHVYVDHGIDDANVVEVPLSLRKSSGNVNVASGDNMEEDIGVVTHEQQNIGVREDLVNVPIGNFTDNSSDTDGEWEPTCMDESSDECSYIPSSSDEDEEIVQCRHNKEKLKIPENRGEGQSLEEECDSDECPDIPHGLEDEWDEFDNPRPKFPQYKKNIENKDVSFCLKQTFTDANEFKEAVLKYSLGQQLNIRISRSETTKVCAQCAFKGCPWRIWCSKDRRTNRFMVKTFSDEHNCVNVGRKNKLISSDWLAKTFLEKIRSTPSCKAKEMLEDTQRMYNIRVSIHQCFRAKDRALKMIQGDQTTHFAKLWDYELELKRSNRGSTISLEPMNNLFHRFYIGFESLKRGFQQGCRRIIGLDGCFLKWHLKGELLAAVGRDANNQMFPIAWAIVEVECTDSWKWFLQHLADDLGIGDGFGWTFITDGQKGLGIALETGLPLAEHRLCARHIYANWRKKHKEPALKPLFWVAAKSYNKPDFQSNMEKIKEISVQAYDDLMKQPPTSWCRAFFNCISKCDSVDNNMCEVFNGTIREARTKSVIEMLEDIRRKMMVRMAIRSEEIEKWHGKLSPRVQNSLEKKKRESVQCEVLKNGKGLFEVVFRGDGFIVNLRSKTCACLEWELTGVPCFHAIAAMFSEGVDVENYVDECYSKEAWARCYEFMINPVNGERLWVRTGRPPILPPMPRAMPGRKKKNRRKDPHESPKRPGKLTKHGRVVTCRLCSKEGHYSVTCTSKGESSGSSTANKQKRPRGRPRKYPQESQRQPKQKKTEQANIAKAQQGVEDRQSNSHGSSSSTIVRRTRSGSRAPEGFGIYTNPHTGITYFRDGQRSTPVAYPSTLQREAIEKRRKLTEKGKLKINEL